MKITNKFGDIEVGSFEKATIDFFEILSVLSLVIYEKKKNYI